MINNKSSTNRIKKFIKNFSILIDTFVIYCIRIFMLINYIVRKNQVFINIDRYGNTTAGTIPICIDEAVEFGRLQDGNLLLIAAFGAGFTWGSMLIRWGK